MKPICLVVDTSALVAIMASESWGDWFADTIRNASDTVISAGTLQEFIHVMMSRSIRAGDDPAFTMHIPTDVLALLEDLEINVRPLTAELALIGGAASATLRVAPARLNLGDGFAYALAQLIGCPIVCLGNDFAQTDIEVLQPPAA